MLAASVLLMRLSVGGDIGDLQFRRAWSTRSSAVGVLIYAGVGLISLVLGGRFLDYSLLPLGGLAGPELRSMGILLVEVGVGMGVMGTLISIFDDLMEGEGGG